MCRVVVVYGRLGVLERYYEELVRGLVGASYYDPYMVRAFGERSHSHSDGWGRLRVAIGSGKIAIDYYRSLSPIYVDRPNLSIRSSVRDYSNPLVVELLHSRAGSAGMPVNIFSVQPFEFQTRTGSRLFLIHNGLVDKGGLAGELGDLGEEVLGRYSDSYIMGLWLARRLGDTIDESNIRELKEYVRTALNIALLLVGPARVEVVAGSYYREELPPEKKDYYKVYVAELGDLLVLASSTIVDFEEYKPRSIESWRELENGSYYKIAVDLRVNDEPKATISKFTI